MQIMTSSYRYFRPDMGQPVVVSLTTPHWRPEARQWPTCELLTPRWAYFKTPAEEFNSAYLAQLEAAGTAEIAACLHQIGSEYQAETLVLICHEAKVPVTAATCHRRLFADWWLATGQTVTEIE